MRNRLRKAMAAIGRAVLAVVSAIRGAVLFVVSSRDEVVVLVGLALVTAALWPRFEQGALLVPGLVLLWVALPTRDGFVARDTPRASKEPS